MNLDPRIFNRLAWAIPAGLLALAAARWWRGYEWQLAVITGIAVGALTFVALRTFDRMRVLLRRQPPP